MSAPSPWGPHDDRFFDLSPDLMSVVGSDGCFLRVNPAWERVLGYTVDELLGRRCVDLVHPDDVARTDQNRCRHKDGSYRWIAWTRADARADEPVHAIGRDVTGHRLAELRLSRQAAELDAVFRALPDLVFRTDESARIVAYSAGREADLYAAPEAFLGKTFAEVLPPELGRSIDLAIARSRASGQIEALEYDLAVPAGLQRFEARVIASLDGHTVTVVRNVTDRWRAQQALAASEARLRESERLEAVGRLAGGVAHDFNNLMMVVLMRSDTVLRDMLPDDPNRRELLEIHGAGQRASDLTRQLLAFARKQVLSPSVLDPAAVVLDMERMLRGVVGEQIELSLRCTAGVACVRVDRSQLEQVVLNLVLNARDAMAGGGRLDIELTRDEVDAETAGRLELAGAGDYVRLAVRDTGAGIDPVDRPRIFEPFFTTKGLGNGTGLGLATVYGVVRQSGGAISVESAVGGTTFTILLPRADAPAAEPPPAPVAELPKGSETILVVEDDAAVRRAVVSALGPLGYQILEARNGEEALRLAGRYEAPIHLLLTDVVMPELGGPDLARRFLAARPEARVVYMSGYSPGSDSSGWPPGLALQKPFPPRRLAECVRQALDAVSA